MSDTAVATAIKRHVATWLHYGGDRHILIKKTDGRYLVQEAKRITTEDGIPVLKTTGRSFVIGNGKVDMLNSPILAGMMESFTEQDLETELVIAKTLLAWGCPSDKLISTQDGTSKTFKIAK